MLEGNQPVGGSGIDMSADLGSLEDYMDLWNYRQPGWAPLYEGGAEGYIDPLTPTTGWVASVEKNPIYAWFMAGLKETDHGKSLEKCWLLSRRILSLTFFWPRYYSLWQRILDWYRHSVGRR
jgi:hypothetical protein